jgi:hypothetical protein
MFESRHEKSIRAVTALLFKAHDALFLDAKSREDILKNPRVRELELAIGEALKLAEDARFPGRMRPRTEPAELVHITQTGR